jgi:hypothetical protein
MGKRGLMGAGGIPGFGRHVQKKGKEEVGRSRRPMGRQKETDR